MAEPVTYKLTVEVDEDERETLKDLLQKHDLIHCLTAEEIVTTTTDMPKAKKPKIVRPKAESSYSGGNSGGDGADGTCADQLEEHDGRCPYCFLNPRIAQYNRNATWLGNGQAPSNDNPSIRINIYRRFWKCINNMYGWHIPEYIEKKKRIGGGEWAVMHQREIMSECVLKLARNLYPNPKGIPYLAHKWE